MADAGAGAGKPDVYAIVTEDIDKGIYEYVDPVFDRLQAMSSGYSQAAAELEQGHGGATGWVGGGSGTADIRVASSSFFNSIVWRAQHLAAESAELATSLSEYREALRAHVKWAKDTDNLLAGQFNRILADLDERSGRWPR